MIKSRVVKLLGLLALILGLQTSTTFSGVGPSFVFEGTTNVLVSYYDLRDRSTFVQVTNTDPAAIATLHIQIFADLNNCEDRDFFDTLTPNETHVYDISNLATASGTDPQFELPANSHGFVIISSADTQALIGNFRIVDNSGYEYRVNSAALSTTSDGIDLIPAYARFSDDWGATQADVVVADTENVGPGITEWSVDTSTHTLNIIDDEEIPLSCGEVIFSCDEGDPLTVGFINQGINNIFPNSKGGNVICSGDLRTDGYIQLNVFDEEDVGFIGLNDGSGRGSMDRFKGEADAD